MAAYKGRETGTFGDVTAVSYNGNKIVMGSSGGAVLTIIWRMRARSASGVHRAERMLRGISTRNLAAATA